MTKRKMLQRICDIWLERGEGVDSEMFIRQHMKHTHHTIEAWLAKIETEVKVGHE